MITLVIFAVAFFVTMTLMRMTMRTARRTRGDGIRWRGIDWGALEEQKPPPEGEGAPERGEDRSDA